MENYSLLLFVNGFYIVDLYFIFFIFCKICLFLACTYQNCFVIVLTCNKLSVYDGEAV